MAFVSQAEAEFRVIADESCYAFEANELAFEYTQDNVFFLRFSFDSVISEQMRKGYKRVFDDDGQSCIFHIESRINRTVDSFKRKLNDINDNQMMLYEYLKRPYLMERKRASAGGVAVALSLIDLIATGASYFYTDYRLKMLREKVLALDELVNSLNTDRNAFKSNQEYLYEEGKIQGIHKQMLVDHFNELSQIHSCDVLHLEMETEIAKISGKLEGISRALMKNEVTEDVISLSAMEELTATAPFRGTIYLVAPMELYSLGRLSLHSTDANGVTLLVSFPEISRRPVFKVVTILETSKKFLVPRFQTGFHFKFLVPKSVSLEDLEMHIDEIRSTDSCVNVNKVLACHPFSTLSRGQLMCIDDLLNGTNGMCFGGTDEKNLTMDYGMDGVLVETKMESEIIDLHSGEIIERLNGHSCTYAENYHSLAVKTQKKVIPVFHNPPTVETLDGIDIGRLDFRSVRAKNFSLPKIPNPVKFKNVTFTSHKSFLEILKNPWVSSGVMVTFICSTILCVIFSCLVAKYCKNRNSNIVFNFGGQHRARDAADMIA